MEGRGRQNIILQKDKRTTELNFWSSHDQADVLSQSAPHRKPQQWRTVIVIETSQKLQIIPLYKEMLRCNHQLWFKFLFFIFIIVFFCLLWLYSLRQLETHDRRWDKRDAAADRRSAKIPTAAAMMQPLYIGRVLWSTDSYFENDSDCIFYKICRSTQSANSKHDQDPKQDH